MPYIKSYRNYLRDKCPLIYNIVETLLLIKDDQSVQSQQRVRSATHALAILVSLRNQKIQNNFKLMFTMLCGSHGAGERFVTLLNHIGLNISWKKIIQFLDSRLKQKSLLLKKKTEDTLPIILLMDKRNTYGYCNMQDQQCGTLLAVDYSHQICLR